MASGKSTVGRLLARIIGWGFVDLDEEIEVRTGCTIPELLTEGEEVFRREERKALEAVSAIDQLVIALGGGAVEWGDAIDYISGHGLLIYLRVDTGTLTERLRDDAGDRPLAASHSGDGLRARVEQLIGQRRPYYESAPVIIECGTDRTPESIAEELLHELG